MKLIVNNDKFICIVSNNESDIQYTINDNDNAYLRLIKCQIKQFLNNEYISLGIYVGIYREVLMFDRGEITDAEKEAVKSDPLIKSLMAASFNSYCNIFKKELTK